SVWDAIVLHGIEALPSGAVVNSGLHLHRLTATNALRTGYGMTTDPALKLRILLQAAAFVRAFPVDSKDWTPFKTDQLQPAVVQAPPSASAVFDLLGTGHVSSAEERVAPSTPLDRSTRLNAARLLLTWLDAAPISERSARRAAYRIIAAKNVGRKARNAHVYKFAYAIFSEVDRVGESLKNRLLATSALHANGSQSADIPTWVEMNEALDKLDV
ncbi:MAG: hypothetical protein KC502_20815, partial [Myxococcales bacterium]|nr:hypothetical protein [Myxococcales bacterium]